jgi:cellobiose phosphorylase
MQSAAGRLVNRDAGLIQLLDPPFDKSSLNPGYIKGYVPGVRENGGQYTHAAIWFVMALLKLKEKKQGWELLQMINPIHRSDNAEAVQRYKVEPYVMAADVYAERSHLGRGGWTWYTGSAGWMYQLIIEFFVGMTKRGDRLYFDPCLPDEWTDIAVTYRYADTVYHITIHLAEDASAPVHIVENGESTNQDFIALVNDNTTHEVRIEVAKHLQRQIVY